MIKPIKNGKITGLFRERIHPVHKTKKFHNGIDIAAKNGAEIVSISSGIVDKVWNDTKFGGGLSTVIRHYNGYVSGYCHQSEQLVKIGQVVKEGEVIGKVGSTGKSTGNHLHFTLSFNGEKINPLNIIKF